jgi:NAD(P)-dependent dehydrogenase (short-subunit alcohol dehydrogenase family)
VLFRHLDAKENIIFALFSGYKLVDEVRDRFGRIDILVNNAVTSPAVGPALDADERL